MKKPILSFIILILYEVMLAQNTSAPWYHSTSIYQIYPRSFYDTNGDGIGDIKGIIQKLDYIKDLGFDAIWCSPFFASPQQDFGYDISDYTAIAPEYGTMQDAQQLIDEVHKRGMKIVFDMVMNHTSDKHPWFLRDEKRETQGIGDFYIWRDKPNNWKSMTGGSGWQYSEIRKQYYYASFLSFQPDLNYRNPAVKSAMFNIVKFWLGNGVDGFRLDIFNVIYKDDQFRDNPRASNLVPTETNPSGFYQKAEYTINRPESFDFAKELRSVCNEYGDKVLLGEVSGNRKTIRKFMGDEKNDGLGLVFNFEMLPFKFKAKYFHDLVENIESDFPNPFMPVYVFSNHDRRRSMKRLNGDVRKAKLLHLFQLTVRGVPCMYYGEEIGMSDVRMSYKKALDPIPHKFKNVPRFLFDWNGETINRDELRTPMQWDSTINAGFSSATSTWLQLAKDYATVNVARQVVDENSLLNTIKKLLQLRKDYPVLQNGSLQLIDSDKLPKGVLGFRRNSEAGEITVFINFTKQKKKIDSTYLSSKKVLHLENGNTESGIALGAFGAIILSSK